MISSASAVILGNSIQKVLDASPCTLYRVSESEPIISAGLHLSQLDVEGVVATDKAGKATGVILGYNVMRLVNPKSVWSTFYQTRVADSKMRVLLARAEDPAQTIVKGILNHGWGYAIVVNAEGIPTNLIGLLDLAGFLVKAGYAARVTNVKAKEHGTNPLVSISEGTTVMDAVATMLEKHIRRLYVKEVDKVVSDRGVIKWLLFPTNLAKLRDSPAEVLSVPVGALGQMLHKPVFVQQDCDAATALQLICKEDARCLITDDRKMILTPWDLTINLLSK